MRLKNKLQFLFFATLGCLENRYEKGGLYF